MWQMLQRMQLQGYIFELMKHLFMVIFVLLPMTSYSQIAIKYVGGERAFYHRGDTVSMVIQMRLSPQSCLDGMKKTYLFFSGCEKVKDNQWRQLPSRIFQKQISVRITDNARKAMVTVTRDTDKESLFKQEIIKLK